MEILPTVWDVLPQFGDKNLAHFRLVMDKRLFLKPASFLATSCNVAGRNATENKNQDTTILFSNGVGVVSTIRQAEGTIKNPC